MTRGLLLFAHGSRNPAWVRTFERLRDEVRVLAPHRAIALCYLELCEPDFASGVASLIARGVTDIEVCPVFLAPGKHTLEDLPALVAQARAAHPNVTFTSRAALLEDDTMRAAIARAVLET
jgi:sirohydrochlorin cobaltochelatase